MPFQDSVCYLVLYRLYKTLLSSVPRVCTRHDRADIDLKTNIYQWMLNKKNIRRRVWRYQREVIRIRRSKKRDRQHNGHKKQDIEANNELQNMRLWTTRLYISTVMTTMINITLCWRSYVLRIHWCCAKLFIKTQVNFKDWGVTFNWCSSTCSHSVFRNRIVSVPP